MRIRYLAILAFFVFLYIGPVNLLPYDVPPTIVEQPQEAKKETVVSTDLAITLAADTDDDWWKWQDGVGYTHYTGSTLLQNINTSTIDYMGQQRFQLNIPNGATIQSANLTWYEVNDPVARECILKRIDEDNVGPLESDTIIPSIANGTNCTYMWDGVGSEWSDPINITEIVQEAVNLETWSSGNYVGWRIHWTATHVSGVHDIEDYQHADDHLSYLNITYTGGEDEEETPYGQEWLTGWGRRQQLNLSQTAGTGANYTVPLLVWNGIGGSWLNHSYTNGYAQEDFDDIRFTQNNGSIELEYQLNTTWEEEITDYICNDSVEFGGYPVNYPQSVYYNQRTYITRQGPERDPFIAFYDHENESFSGWTRVGNNSILHAGADSHGVPCMFIDNESYLHVFYGAHNSIIYHTKSDYPESISGWTAQTDVDFGAGGSTYPHLFYDATNDILHCYVRLTGGGGAGTYPLHYRNSTDKGLTWSSGQNIVEADSYFPYTGVAEMDPTNTSLHIGWNRYTAANTSRQDVYYIEFNFTTGIVYNVTGASLGETVSYSELESCIVYNSGLANVWGPNIHLDSTTNPYLTWICGDHAGETTGKAMFAYWTGASWSSVDNVTDTLSWVGGSDFIVHDSTNITAYFSESVFASRNMTKYTWNGVAWTRIEAIMQGGSTRYQGYNIVPLDHDNEIQIVWTEYVPSDTNIKMYVYGSEGLIQYTWAKHALFYVKVPYNISEDDATIYLYYSNPIVSTTENATMTIQTGNDPNFDIWGPEEIEENNSPTNDQTPVCVNLDDTDNLYARYKEYQITANVSDSDGFADLDYLEISLYSNDRGTLYWTIRFDEDTAIFSEQSDVSNMITLNTTASTNATSGNTLNVTFYLTVHWNHTDISDADIRQYVLDDNPQSDTDYYEVNWDVETRLNYSMVPIVYEDYGGGTDNRGNPDEWFSIEGNVTYYGSAINPSSDEIDIWVNASEYGTNVGPWYDLAFSDGYFQINCYADDEVGLDSYTIKPVIAGAGSGGSSLYYTTDIQLTYIADRLNIDIQADDESPENNQQVSFIITITYEYDGTSCTIYTIQIARNAVYWHTFTHSNYSLFNDTNSQVTYSYNVSSYLGLNTHGVTNFTTNTETVTWFSPSTTTTPTTETNIFYDFYYEWFFSAEIWSILGAMSIVFVGYFAARKDKVLGVFWFIVECLFVSAYAEQVSTTPFYYWHIFIVLVGGILVLVPALMNRTR